MHSSTMGSWGMGGRRSGSNPTFRCLSSILCKRKRQKRRMTLPLHWLWFICFSVGSSCSLRPQWDVHLTLPPSFKIKKMNRQRMFIRWKQQINTVLSTLPDLSCSCGLHLSFSMDVYTRHVFTGFNMSERCVYVWSWLMSLRWCKQSVTCNLLISTELMYHIWRSKVTQNTGFNPAESIQGYCQKSSFKSIKHFWVTGSLIPFLFFFKHISSTWCTWENIYQRKCLKRRNSPLSMIRSSSRNSL